MSDTKEDVELRAGDHISSCSYVIRSAVRTAFAIDLRSLALFRIGLGLLILTDLVIRATALTAHYTDLGIMPRDLLTERYWSQWHWSLHLVTGSTIGVAALFVIQAVFAAMLLFGFKTRLATIASWALAVSLHNRNFMILNAGDTLLRMLLFWSMFLPLHARWSIDCRHVPAPATVRHSIVSFATFAYITQICVVYWFAAFHKSGPNWWDGQAVYYALNLDYFATSLGLWVREINWLLPWLTYGTLFWELLGPLLLFMPFWHSGFRTLCVLGFVTMHLGFLALLDIELFALISVLGWVPLLPGSFWNALSVRIRRVMRRLDTSNGSVMQCPGASTRVVFIPYVFLWARNLFVLFTIVYVIFWNIHGLDRKTSRRWPFAHLDVFGWVLRLDQDWGVFAPRPASDDGWFVFDGELADGRHMDLLTGIEPASFDKPALVSSTVPNRRWGKYLELLNLIRFANQRPLLCQYLTHSWNATHPPDESVVALRLYFVREETLPHRIGEPQVILMIECDKP